MARTKRCISILVDENVPAPIWKALSAWRARTEVFYSICEVRKKQKKAPDGTSDDVLVTMANKRGQVILSCDTNDHGTSPLIREIILQDGKLICIPMRLIDTGDFPARALWVFQRWPKIIEEAKKLNPGQCVYVDGTGRVTLLNATDLREREAQIRANRRKSGRKGAHTMAAKSKKRASVENSGARSLFEDEDFFPNQ